MRERCSEVTWITVKEYAEREGISRSTADKRLREAWRAGRLERRQQREIRGDDSYFSNRPLVTYYRTKP